jgi:hypothetical protein
MMSLLRREFLRLAAGVATLPAFTCFARAEPYPAPRVRVAALAEPSTITPALIEGARKEGKVNF